MPPVDRPALPRSEVLMRIITNQHWQIDTLHPDLFAGREESECSLSREAILSRDEILSILRIQLEKPPLLGRPELKVWGYATLTAGDLVDWIKEYIEEKRLSAEQAKAVADPIETPPPPNPAHALIVPRTTGGMSKRLRDKVQAEGNIFRSEELDPNPSWVRQHQRPRPLIPE